MTQPQTVERGGRLPLRQRPAALIAVGAARVLAHLPPRRIRGVWPTWCTGVRTAPFIAHAWVEADGHPVGEPQGPGYYRPLIVIPPSGTLSKPPQRH
jgi:hypothetical protein